MRLDGLPRDMRDALRDARRARGWSQKALGRKVALPQAHVSGIESGRIVPRFDTLLDLVRVLDFDLMMVPRSLVPPVQALIREGQGEGEDGEEQPLYADARDDA
jgi:HTH-type transcriptional regulator/antitoxin HipB